MLLAIKITHFSIIFYENYLFLINNIECIFFFNNHIKTDQQLIFFVEESDSFRPKLITIPISFQKYRQI